MDDNSSDVVLYSFDKFTQNRHVYYQQNGGFKGKRKPDGFPSLQQNHFPCLFVITCFQFVEINS